MSWFGGGSTQPATSTASTPFSFGLGATNQQQPSAPGFGFGAAAPPTAGSAPAFSFGLPSGTTVTTASAAAPFSLGLGGTATSAAPAPSYGGSLFGTTTTATQAAPPSFGFGSTTTSSTSYSIPTATTGATSGGGFTLGLGGTTALSQPTQPFSFGAPPGTTQSQQPQAAPTGTAAPFSFGLSTATSAPPSSVPYTLGIGIGASTAAPISTTGSLFPTTTWNSMPPSGFGLGLSTTSALAASTTTATTGGLTLGTPAYGLTVTQPSSMTTTQTLPGGLGGISGSSINSFGIGLGTGISNSSVSSRLDQRGIKELQIPAELHVLVDELKSHIKNEKVKVAEVSRATYRSVEQVTSVLDETRATLLSLSNIINRQTHNCDAFRQQMAQDVRDAEMAHMTKETPIALQLDNDMPLEYFFRLVNDYETKMIIYRREIKKSEAAIAAISTNTNVNATGQDLAMSLKSVKDGLIVIAAKVKTLHERVSAEVETHKNLLRFVHGDTTRDMFMEKSKNRYNRWEPQSEDATNVIFQAQVKDPTKLYMSYMAGSRDSSLFHGAPTFGRPSYSTSKHPYIGGYGSTTLFQSPTSPIFNPHSATSLPPPTGISLKRSKH